MPFKTIIFLCKLLILLFKGGCLANTDQTANTIQNTFHSVLTDFITFFLLVGYLVVKSRTPFSLSLVFNLQRIALGFGFLFGTKSGFLFRFGLFRFLLLLGYDEVRSLQMRLACKLF